MKSKTLRNVTFSLHRYVGLFVGLLLIIIGLTGSLLVFEKEIDHFLTDQQFGRIIPQEQRVPIESVVDTVKAAFSDRPDLKIASINTLPGLEEPYKIWLKSPDEKWTEAIVNPYTDKILGTRQWENTLIGFTFDLHYRLLAGKAGEILAGIVALLLFILCVTGVMLWSGWKKLINGFKIKWNAHPKRTNYDLHKVAGIVTAVFLAFTAFTGFCWNFSDFTYPAIYAVTLTPKPPETTSLPQKGKSPLALAEVLKSADAALPSGVTTYVSLPGKPDGVYRVGKKLPQDTEEYGSSEVYLDQYSGKVVYLQNGSNLGLGDRVLNSFAPLHYGTFWGLPTRILYVFVGLAPLVLFVTGFVMWRYRYRVKLNTDAPTPELIKQR